jgi:Sulfotransferase family
LRRREALSELSAEARREALIDWIRATTATALGMAPERVDLDRVLPDPAQLFALIRPRALSDLELALYDYDLPFFTSLRAAAFHLAQELAPVPLPAAPMKKLYGGGIWAWGPVDRTFASRLDQPVVVILSAARTGSTLLRMMLAGHPQLFAPPELHLLPFERMGRRRLMLEKLGYPWMRSGLASALHALGGLTAHQAEAEVTGLERRDAPVMQVIGRLQDAARPRILVDKSPSTALHPAWLGYAEQAFQNARYIHLVRHPAAAIESFVRMRFHRVFSRHWLVWDENPWLYGEKCWTSANLQILDFLRPIAADRQIRVSYEELVGDPRIVATDICRFLGIPLDEALLSPYSGQRSIEDVEGRGPAMGDPNFLTHTGIDGSLAERGMRRGMTLSFGQATREVAALLGYPL